MVTIQEIGWKACLRCKKSIPLLEQGSLCKSCQSFLDKINYKRETKKQYLSNALSKAYGKKK